MVAKPGYKTKVLKSTAVVRVEERMVWVTSDDRSFSSQELAIQHARALVLDRIFCDACIDGDAEEISAHFEPILHALAEVDLLPPGFAKE